MPSLDICRYTAVVTEPDVALTDYGLICECVVFTCLLGKSAHSQKPDRYTKCFLLGSRILYWLPPTLSFEIAF